MALERMPPGFDPLSAGTGDTSSPAMGALGQIMANAGRNRSDEDSTYAAGLLAPSSNGTSGALGNAMANVNKYRLERDQLQAQYLPLILQSMQSQFQREAIGNILGGGDSGQQSAAPQGPQTPGASPQSAPGAAQGSAGMQAATGAPPQGMGAPAGQTVATPPQNPGSKLASYTIDQITALDRLTGLNLTDAWKIAKEGFERKPGSAYDVPGVGMVYVDDPKSGIGYRNGKVVALPGAAQAQAELAGATTGAQKLAENQNSPLPPTFVDDKTNKPIGGTMAQYIAAATGAPSGASPASSGAPGVAAPNAGMKGPPQDQDRAMIMSKEFDTALDRLHNLDPKTADAATVKATNDDLNAIVKEMRNQKVAYVPAALRPVTIAAGDVTPQAIAQAEGSAPGAPQLQGAAQAAGAKTTAEAAAASGQKYQDALHDKVEEEFQLVQRNKQIAPLLDKIQTGGFAPEARVEFANEINNTAMLPDGMKKTLATWVANGDPTAGKVLQNQLASAGILTMLQTLDKEGKPNRAIFQAVQQAQEGLKSGNATLKDVFALQDRLYKIHYDEQQAITDALKKGTYDPRTWAGEYSKVRNAQLQHPAEPLPSAQTAGGWSVKLKQ